MRSAVRRWCRGGVGGWGCEKVSLGGGAQAGCLIRLSI